MTCKGSFAYASAVLPGEEDAQPLLRLRYCGSARSFGFALHPYSSRCHEDAVLLTGLPAETRRKHSTPPARSTSPTPATIPNPDP